MKKITIKQIKQELNNRSFPNLCGGKAFYYFRRSDYFKYIIEENSLENVAYYAEKFSIDVTHLNII